MTAVNLPTNSPSPAEVCVLEPQRERGKYVKQEYDGYAKYMFIFLYCTNNVMVRCKLSEVYVI